MANGNGEQVSGGNGRKRGGDRRSAAAQAQVQQSVAEQSGGVTGLDALVGTFNVDNNQPITAEQLADDAIRVTMKQAQAVLAVSHNTIRKLFKPGDDGAASPLATTIFEYPALGTSMPVTSIGALRSYMDAQSAKQNARGGGASTDPNKARAVITDATPEQTAVLNAIGDGSFEGDLGILRGLHFHTRGEYRKLHARDGEQTSGDAPVNSGDLAEQPVDPSADAVLEGANS
jgi:hypothetical protein